MRSPLLKLSLFASSLCVAAVAHAGTITVGTPGSGGNPDSIGNPVVYVINTSVAAGYTFLRSTSARIQTALTRSFFTGALYRRLKRRHFDLHFGRDRLGACDPRQPITNRGEHLQSLRHLRNNCQHLFRF